MQNSVIIEFFSALTSQTKYHQCPLLFNFSDQKKQMTTEFFKNVSRSRAEKQDGEKMLITAMGFAKVSHIEECKVNQL